MPQGIARATLVFEEGEEDSEDRGDFYSASPQEKAILHAKAATQLEMSWSIDAIDPARVFLTLELPGEITFPDDTYFIEEWIVTRLRTALMLYGSRGDDWTSEEIMKEMAEAIRLALDPTSKPQTELPEINPSDTADRGEE